MTINDQKLTEYTRIIHGCESRIDYLTRDGRRMELLTELAKIEDAARKAQWRLLGVDAK